MFSSITCPLWRRFSEHSDKPSIEGKNTTNGHEGDRSGKSDESRLHGLNRVTTIKLLNDSSLIDDFIRSIKGSFPSVRGVRFGAGTVEIEGSSLSMIIGIVCV